MEMTLHDEVHFARVAREPGESKTVRDVTFLRGPGVPICSWHGEISLPAGRRVGVSAQAALRLALTAVSLTRQGGTNSPWRPALRSPEPTLPPGVGQGGCRRRGWPVGSGGRVLYHRFGSRIGFAVCVCGRRCGVASWEGERMPVWGGWMWEESGWGLEQRMRVCVWGG